MCANGRANLVSAFGFLATERGCARLSVGDGRSSVPIFECVSFARNGCARPNGPNEKAADSVHSIVARALINIAHLRNDAACQKPK